MIEAYLYWIAFAISDGIEEAKIFEYKGHDIKWPSNIHYYFNIQRIIVGLILLSVFRDLYTTPFDVFLLGSSMMLCFPFFHDGAYYQSRGFLDKNDYHFFSQSITTNAKISLSPRARAGLFIISLIIQMTLI